jgi:predicted O-linked N-acetylglucosamine transferase (SPINDLY family)
MKTKNLDTRSLPNRSVCVNPFDGIENEFDAQQLLAYAQWRDETGDAGEALKYYQYAIKSEPEMLKAHYRCGLLLLQQGRWRQSIHHLKTALELQPDFVEAAHHLAVAFYQSGQPSSAVPLLQAILLTDKTRAESHFQLGMCLLSMGRPQEAGASISKSINYDQQNARYWFHLAEARLSDGEVEAAEACYVKAVNLKPDWEAAHYNLAIVLRMAEKIEEAILHAKRAQEINPNYTKALPLLFRLAQHSCNWGLVSRVAQQLEMTTRLELQQKRQTTEPPLTHIRRSDDVAQNARVAQSWSRRWTGLANKMGSELNSTYGHSNSGTIRVGYISSDFKDHAVAYQIRGILEKHNRKRFEIFGYACNPDDGSPYRRLLADACDHFHDVHRQSNLSIAKQIQKDGIQVFVDMSGHSKGNRLGIAALRPAPVQVSYLGFLSSTGADFIDYVLADKIVLPEAQVQYYSEKVVYLPHCYQANDDRISISRQPQSRKQWGLPAQGTVYCCFNQPYKIDHTIFAVWMRILKRVENSVLWLVKRTSLACENLRREAVHAGVDPNRLIFTGFVPMDINLARLQLADLVLDTKIYNGGATTANALWAGVPLITNPGRHWVSRMSASALYAMGLKELVADDLVAYETLAVELGLQPARLNAIRNKLAEQRRSTPLFDTELFCRHMESAYETMWKQWQSGLPPTSFTVSP